MIPLRDDNPVRTFPLVNYLLIAANVVVFLYMFFLPEGAFESFMDDYSLIPALISEGRNLHTIFTSMFLHGGFGHIIGNMLFLGIFGDNIEDALGHAKYFLFYLLCGVGGSLLQYIISPQLTIPSLGASGAIAGLMGSYLVLFPTARVEVLVPTYFSYRRAMVPAQFMLVYWILAQFFYGAGSFGAMNMGGVAYFAHIGGFATGWLLTKGRQRGFPGWREGRRRARSA